MNKIFMGVLMSTLVFTSCKKEEVTPVVTTTEPVTVALVEIASTTNGSNQTVKLFSESGNLTTGYTNFYVSVTDDSGNSIESASVEFAPLMTMTSMAHACPIEQPTFNATLGKYKGAVVFIMSSMGGDWTLDVSVDGTPVTFNLTVAESNTKVVGMYTGSDGTSYVISLLRPTSWQVGMNDLEVLIHKRASMMNFPADNDFTIDMDPEMMSMGHGSPNNISPVSIGNGHYSGHVNFTMTGDWRMHMILSKAGAEIHPDAFLDIVF